MSLMKNAPSVSVRDDGNGRVQAAHHLGCSDEVVHGCNGEIGLAKTGSGCSGTAVTLFQYLASRERVRDDEPLVHAIKTGFKSTASADTIADSRGDL